MTSESRILFQRLALVLFLFAISLFCLIYGFVSNRFVSVSAGILIACNGAISLHSAMIVAARSTDPKISKAGSSLKELVVYCLGSPALKGVSQSFANQLRQSDISPGFVAALDRDLKKRGAPLTWDIPKLERQLMQHLHGVALCVLLHRLFQIVNKANIELPAPQIDVNCEATLDLIWFNRKTQSALGFTILEGSEETWMHFLQKNYSRDAYDFSDETAMLALKQFASGVCASK